MAAQLLHFIQVVHDDQDFASVMASTRRVSRFGDCPTAESYIHFRRVRKQNFEYVKHIEDCKSWSLRLARAVPNYQIHRGTSMQRK